MTVAFKELAGSPVETYGPDGLRATRTLLCAWDDREALVEQLLGDGYEYGGQSRAPYPDKPDVVALRIRCEPFADDVTPQVLTELTEGLNRYDGFAKITVDYELLVPSDRQDLPAIETGTFLTYRQDFGVEKVTLAGDGLTWVDAPTVEVPAEIEPALRVPTIEHDLTWHRVLDPPWAAIRNGVGTVNAQPFLGAAAGTVLLCGARAEREFINIDRFASPELAWQVRYVLLEKAVKAAGGDSVGWNHAYRSLPADAPGWDELTDPGGNRLYASTDFTQLFRFGTTS
ncbi:MAG: hypothetical protein JXB62_19985 [Pirellulales bacterium]|nr:hypothetical protein [Pirellulales bacterium]